MCAVPDHTAAAGMEAARTGAAGATLPGGSSSIPVTKIPARRVLIAASSGSIRGTRAFARGHTLQRSLLPPIMAPMFAPPLRDRAIQLAKRILPASTRERVVRMQRKFRFQWPPRGTVRFGSFRRLSPISPVFALDRGFPIERYYIERFLGAHRADIIGRAMEFGDTFYLDKFGGEGLTAKEVFSYVESEGATIIGDLTGSTAPEVEPLDCIVCTQTIQMIYDIRLAVRRLHAMLKPGGVLLLTSHGTSKIGRHLDTDGWGEYWHLTQQAARSLFEENFEGDVEIDAYGNVLTAMCALHGLAAEELSREELEYKDRGFDVIITVRAVRSA